MEPMDDTTELTIRYHSKDKRRLSRLVNVDPMWDWRGASDEMASVAAFVRHHTSNTKNLYHQSNFSQNHGGNLHQWVLHSLRYLSTDVGARRLQRGCMSPPVLLWGNLRAPGIALGPCLRLSVHRPRMGHVILRRAAR